MKNNEKVKQLTSEIERSLDKASNESDLSELIQKVIDFGSPLKYNNTKQYVSSFILIAFSVVLCFFIKESVYDLSIAHFSLILIPMAVAVAIAVYAANRSFSLSTLSDKIFNKDIMFDNGLFPEKIVNGDALANKLGETMHEFNWGNHSRDIEFLAKGLFYGPDKCFNYSYYCLHYVNARTVVQTTPDGKGGVSVTTSIVYDHHHRYGIMFNVVGIDSVLVASKSPNKGYPEKYKTASIKFTENFKISCELEINAAKLTKPTVVVALEDATDVFEGLNLEISKEGVACLSTSDNLLELKRIYGLDNPVEFKDEINQKHTHDKLNSMLELAYTIKTNTDRNFRN